MRIDTGSFFILVGTLAAGGGAGYFASQKHLLEGPPLPSPPKDPPVPAPASTAAASAAPSARPATPTCDDALGSPGNCPPPGYSAEEGGCGALPTKRCNDFKQTMKPKVAERAVACLNALKPPERCDPIRLNLCGHLALMNACQEPEDADKDAVGSAAGGVTAVCQAIVQECAAAPLGPTLRDCRATLAGMSELGKSKVVSCMSTHCSDRGLLYCEAVVDMK
jgi:hypothetical protein